MRFGYRRLTEASFLLLTIRDAEAARAWLRRAPVSNAVACDAAPRTALHLAFTSDGLHRLGLPDEVLTQFPPEFLVGMAGDPSRSRLLGDTGNNSPEFWAWGTGQRQPHLVAMLYAQPGEMHAWSEQLRTLSFHEAFHLIACLSTSDLDGREPFGFVDGVSQPSLDWERTRSLGSDQLVYSNLSSLGEFLLGYPNEYGHYTDRPLLEADDPSAAALPRAEDQPALGDLGRNGCFLVLRTLEQDVLSFRKFLQDQAGPEISSQHALAAAMVGRKADGSTLVPLSTGPIEGIAPNDDNNRFTFDRDESGLACPFGAHIRRANPRNADLPTPPVHGLKRLLHTLGFGGKNLRTDAKASTRFHRLLRRGREYGPAQAAKDDETPMAAGQGIHFVALVANITRQFEFVQNAWLMSSKFDAGTDESDPLLGNRAPIPGADGTTVATDTFSIPRESGLRDRVCGLPQFVTVKGGAYFFLPSLPAIQYLASLGKQTPST